VSQDQQIKYLLLAAGQGACDLRDLSPACRPCHPFSDRSQQAPFIGPLRHIPDAIAGHGPDNERTPRYPGWLRHSPLDAPVALACISGNGRAMTQLSSVSRRRLLVASGALALTLFLPASLMAEADTGGLRKITDDAAPISLAERETRIERARALMHEAESTPS
jgi:hypothetical protein